MKTYYNNKEVERDIKNGILNINDDIEIAFDGFSINADIKCHNIYSKKYKRDITANNINARDINAWDVTANDIIANGNITANDITARDINACDINADNINANNITAYNNIKCKSIKGRRDNAKHFCLDGDITIVKDEIIEELTMEEVCKRLGKTIKIKK